MPLSYVDHMAKKYKISTEEAESLWRKAKEAVGPEKDTDDGVYWATVVTVFKKILTKNINRR